MRSFFVCHERGFLHQSDRQICRSGLMAFLYTNIGYTMSGVWVHPIECKLVLEGCNEGANEVCLRKC